MKISGEIVFAGNAPKSPLAEPSILVVQLEDCRKVGAPSIDIGKVEIDAHEVYVKGKPLTYCLNVPTFVVGTEYQVSKDPISMWFPFISSHLKYLAAGRVALQYKYFKGSSLILRERTPPNVERLYINQ